ncbi:MAG: SGNH/GDSL hydrolase family protein [Anaerolineae bacterium]|nr:SGNH/GDSL hydrolase family protein [Anaerolineae bacterium]
MIKKVAVRIGGNLLISAGSILVTLIVIEITLRLFFPVSDMPLSTYEPGVGLHLAPNQTGVWVVGATGEIQGHYQINAAGWNAIREYDSHKPADTFRIAVIGDSYVEALQVDVAQSFPAVLESILQASLPCNGYSTIEVYGFGYSGAQLAQYLNMMRYVDKRYHPDLYVINIVGNDFDESIVNPYPRFMSFRQDENGEFVEVPPVPYSSPVRSFMKKFALVRYVYLNLQAPQALPAAYSLFKQQSEGTQPVAGGPQTQHLSNPQQDMIAQLTRHIFIEYQTIAVKRDSDLMLVLDADRNAIYASTPPSPILAWQNTIAHDAAMDLGIDLIDLASAFTDDYQQYGEPFNSSADYHWNVHGHAIVADAVSRWLVDRVCAGRSASR